MNTKFKLPTRGHSTYFTSALQRKMGLISTLVALLAGTIFCAQVWAQTFMPDNDLWKQDRLFKSTPNVSEAMFNKIVQAGREAYAEEATSRDETLTINGNWDDSTVNANSSRMFGSVTINMFGGLARRPEISPEGFTLVLCHELGHAYGGDPLIRSTPFFYMSAEGQADYFSTLKCYDKVAERVPELSKITQPSSGILNDCEKYNGNDINYANCIGKLEGGLSLGNLLSKLKNESVPKYETPDQTVVDSTVLSYPATIQCRVDTYRSGALELSRPLCWYKP